MAFVVSIRARVIMGRKTGKFGKELTRQEGRMSRLASAVGHSVRRHKAVSVVGNNEWALPEEEELDVTLDTDAKWELPRANLSDMSELGSGQFGIVYVAKAEGLGKESRPVAVKMLQNSDATADFVKEVKIMKALSKPTNTRVIRLLAVITKDEPPCMIMELMTRGDLHAVLRAERPLSSTPSKLSLRRLILMAADVALGMRQLGEDNIVHRDLAARNCLVDDDWTVKIGDFGLTRDMYSRTYYRMTGAAPLPIRWMAPEALEDGLFTTQSDVWAFGITLWEILTFAKLPYGHRLDNVQVVEKVTDEGFRLESPPSCPPGAYALMRRCWEEDPADRIGFKELHEELAALASSVSAARLVSDLSPKKQKKLQKRAQKRKSAAIKAVGAGHDYAQPLQLLYAMPQDATDDSGDEDAVYYAIPNLPSATAAAANPELYDVLAMETEPALYEEASAEEQGGMSALYEDATASEAARAAPLEEPALYDMADGSSDSPQKVVVHVEATAESPAEDPADPPTPAPAATSASPQKDHLSPTKGSPTRSASVIGRQLASGQKGVSSLVNDTSSVADKARRASAAAAGQTATELREWISQRAQRELPHEDLRENLMDGVALCDLLNSIKKNTVKKHHKNPKLAFHKMENIACFLDGCKALGIPTENLFNTIDLFEGTGMRQVVFCLHAVRKKAGD
eukprot:m.145602 g.145602  ORF g.145602 m.145602 type:complete len:685 (+) comp17227_c0_seq4:56-2110(+)